MTITVDCSKGIALTLKPATTIQAIEQSIYLLLMTPRGEVPCYREFGLDANYLHRPINVAKALYVSAVADAIREFVPEVSLQRVTFTVNPLEPDKLYPKLEVTISEQSD